MEDLIFALLDNSASFPSADAAGRARELTIAWTRFKYSGPILERSDPDTLLQQALATGAHYCVIQPYGYFLAEVWRPEDGEVPEVMAAIREWVASREFLVAGAEVDTSTTGWRTDPGLLLVDLRRYRQAASPDFDLLNPTRQGDRFCPLPRSIASSVVRLDKTLDTFPIADPACPGKSAAAGESRIADRASVNGRDFVDGIHALTRNLRRAVFVWNIESYADVETPPPQFKLPVQALYTVSAGFKPNRILQTHGFTRDTRMVVFDYSQQGLEFRRLIHEEWDGADYPAFLRTLFRKLPPSDTHYLLWDGMTPDNLDWALVDARWQQELAAWGGEDALYDHWQQFRRMTVEYLQCDLLEQQEQLIDRIGDQHGSLIWWSNAFFSIYSIWRYTSAQRQATYRQWIDGLSRKSPRLLLHGSDCNNASVNGCNAGEYAAWLQSATPDPLDELQPMGLSLRRIRY